MNQNQLNQYWSEPCKVAPRIRIRFGVRSALEYIIGGKLVNFVLTAEWDQAARDELPAFVTEIHRLFTQAEIQEYLKGRRAPRLRQVLQAHHSRSVDGGRFCSLWDIS